jgi:Glycosyl transferases group 1
MKPSWGGIADEGRPCIGYAASCQGVPDCGRSSVAGCLREGLGKVANVIDIWGAPEGRVPACDAVLAMECVSLIPEPYFIYLCPEQANPTPMDPAVYERALGLFAGNGRLAQWLAESMGIPIEKIHVIPPAVAAGQGSTRIRPPHMREAPRRKLLLRVSDCGGGPVSDGSVRLVLDALDILRQRHDPQIRLTISGLEIWPTSACPPDGVIFRGASLTEEKMALFDSHDLLVVPPGAGFDGLPEALSVGVPCVAARTSEMSEAITPGITGTFIDDVNARELAAAIVSVLGDDGIYRSCLERAPAMAAYFSWERVARQVTHVISREVGLMH